MATIAEKIAQKQALLAEYLAAESAALKAQEYTIKDRSLTKADLKWIQTERRRLENEISILENGGTIQPKRVVFRDR